MLTLLKCFKKRQLKVKTWAKEKIRCREDQSRPPWDSLPLKQLAGDQLKISIKRNNFYAKNVHFLHWIQVKVHFLFGIFRHLERICYGCRSSHEVGSHFSNATKQFLFWNMKQKSSESKLLFVSSAWNSPKVIISWEMKVLLWVGLPHCWKTFWKRYFYVHFSSSQNLTFFIVWHRWCSGLQTKMLCPSSPPSCSGFTSLVIIGEKWLKMKIMIYMAMIPILISSLREVIKKKTGKKRSGWPLGLTPPLPSPEAVRKM